MPRTPIDYSKTVIYKLVHKEDYDNANVYVGSTTDFTRRKNQHNRNCNNENSKEYNTKKYQYIRNNSGWNGWNMVEVEKYNCNDKREAEAREEYWRSQFNAQLNTNRAYRTEEEKKEQAKEISKEHYKSNKEKKSEQHKKHYEQNKNKKLEKQSQQITCECGCILTQGGLSHHLKSQKHLLLTKQIKYEFVDDNEEN